MRFKRIFLIVVDSFGIGASADASLYHDEECDTFAHIVEQMPNIKLPTLTKLGLVNLHSAPPLQPCKQPIASYACLCEKSAGKDTMSGHWEMMGLHIKEAFQTFTETGFPQTLIQEIERYSGRKVIGNKAASGTEILKELGEREINNHELIVYTSADSVLQICGHEQHMGLETLYDYCKKARELTMKPEWKVGRVIARPYVGDNASNFERTSNRHDYALKPYGKTVLDALKEASYDVIGIGKIRDIFDGEGITSFETSKSSVYGMQQTIQKLNENFCGLCFVNLVDFDAKWGHRRNAIGYGKELESFDEKLGEFIALLKDDDLVMISADHGNDPTYRGSDHTRENVPLLIYSPSLKEPCDLGVFDTFATIGATIADNFNVALPKGCIGTSILGKIK